MAKILEGTNQGTLVHQDPCSFPCFGNISLPIMATLNLLGFIVGLLVSLFANLVVPNSLDASQASTLCQEHQTNPDPLNYSPIKYYPPPTCSSG